MPFFQGKALFPDGMDRGCFHEQPMNTRKQNPVTRHSLIHTAARHSCYIAGILAGSALVPDAQAADIQWTGTTGTWTDPNPPSGKAFYRVVFAE